MLKIATVTEFELRRGLFLDVSCGDTGIQMQEHNRGVWSTKVWERQGGAFDAVFGF
ncbi:MAG: hypothetical protein ABI782_12615 [Anaerolineaceae bacterium]